ncbi:hypothetical protein ACFLXC_04645 [Chloroflexota bacterium]
MDEIADSLRQEPFNTLTNNCLIKSFRFKRRCAELGIKARVVISFGYAPVSRGLRFFVPIIHGWAEVDGCRIELAHPLDDPNVFGTLDSEVKPLAAIWI